MKDTFPTGENMNGKIGSSARVGQKKPISPSTTFYHEIWKDAHEQCFDWAIFLDKIPFRLCLPDECRFHVG